MPLLKDIKMDFEYTITRLIQNGGVLFNVEGKTVSEIYANVFKIAELPDSYDKNAIVKELLEREKVLSTAVGNGIAIPHPRRPLMQKAEDQRIYVCYLKDTIDMNAPDSRRVHVLFILLTNNTQYHIRSLSELAKLFRSPEFRKELESHPSEDQLLDAIAATF